MFFSAHCWYCDIHWLVWGFKFKTHCLYLPVKYHVSSFRLRSTIRNAKSIHKKSRQRLSQDTYRRNSRRYLQLKGGPPTNLYNSSKNDPKSPLRERKNQGNETTIIPCFQDSYLNVTDSLTIFYCLPCWTHTPSSLVTNRQRSQAVWLQFREWAEEGGSSHSSPAQSRAHSRALQWQNPPKSQHPEVLHWHHQLAWRITIFSFSFLLH